MHQILDFFIFTFFLFGKSLHTLTDKKNVPIAMQLDFTSVYIIHFDLILVLLQFIFGENDVYISIFILNFFVWALLSAYYLRIHFPKGPRRC